MRCNRQDRNENAEVKVRVELFVVGTGINTLKSKEELKISNLFPEGSLVWVYSGC